MPDRDPGDEEKFAEFEDSLVRDFLRRRSRQNKQSSVENDKTVFRQYLPFLGDTRASEAEYTDVVDYVDMLVDAGYSKKTIQVYLSTINSFHGYLTRQERMGMPDVSKILEHYNNLEEPHERKPIEREEVTRLIEATDSVRDALIVGFTYYTGTRSSVPATTRVSDVDLEEGTLHIRGVKNSDERTIPIHEDIEFLLKVWLSEERPAYPPAPDSPYLFVGDQSADRLTREDIWEIVHEAAKKAGIQEVVGQKVNGDNIWRVKTHVLRHSFATHGKEDGMSREELAAFLGHQNVESIDIYIHEDDIKEALEAYMSRYGGVV